jgi:hypothetical protein
VSQRLAQIRAEIRAERRAGIPRRRSEKLRISRPIFRKRAVDADAWEPPAVPLLSREEIRKLPDVFGSGARRPGVYFLWLRDEILYVGSSGNVRGRVGEHDTYQTVVFDLATYLAVPWPWHMAVEAVYIRALNPPKNSTFASR